MKENETRLKIAQKILDTISEGDLSAENQQKLIHAFSNETSVTQTDTVALATETSASQIAADSLVSDENDYDNDAEIVETIEHKKETDEVQ